MGSACRSFFLLVAFCALIVCIDSRRFPPVGSAGDRSLPLAARSPSPHRRTSNSPAPQTLFTFNLTYALQSSTAPVDNYEQVQLVAAVAGLANRLQPQLYVFYIDVDASWLDYLVQDDGWLRNTTVVSIDTLEHLIGNFSSLLKGSVVYDPDVPSTSNVASTAAGALDLVPICQRPSDPGSLYNRFVTSGILPVALSLVGLFNGSVTGSKKNDAYRWAIKEFIDTGLSDASQMGYYVDYWWTTGSWPVAYDSNTVSNHDFFISRRGFFFDLDPWPTAVPNDDPSQPLGTDYATLIAIFQAANVQLNASKFIHVGGFPPWLFKYVNQEYPGVPTEWQFARVATSFNAVMDADACCLGGMMNAALYQHYPLVTASRQRFVQNPAPQLADLLQAGYVTRAEDGSLQVQPKLYVYFYAGDYDSAAWVYRMFKPSWDDPARGKVPIGWAPDPSLIDRFPIIFPYLYRTLSPMDVIITGDSGAGYINPSMLFSRSNGLPDAGDMWGERSAYYYRLFSLKFTGFVINGAAGAMTAQDEALYASFSGDGMGEQWGYSANRTDGSIHLASPFTPVFQELDAPSPDAGNTSAYIVSYEQTVHGNLPMFLMVRGVLRSAGFYYDVQQQLPADRIAVVSPLEMAYLARLVLGSSNDNRVTYLADTLPSTAVAGSTLTFNITLRNEVGWNVTLASENDPNVWSWVGALSADVAPGASSTTLLKISLPSVEGSASCDYQLAYSNGTRFSQFANLFWSTPIQVLTVL